MIKGIAVTIDYVSPIAIFRSMEEAKVIVLYWAKSSDVLFEGADLSLVDLSTGKQVEFFNDAFNDADPFNDDLLPFLRQRVVEIYGAGES